MSDHDGDEGETYEPCCYGYVTSGGRDHEPGCDHLNTLPNPPTEGERCCP